MRIDFSEPECSNCYRCGTSGIRNTQESEPSNVIGSSVTSMPVSSGPVQALGNDAPAVGSTSTSSPVGHDSAAVGSTSTSYPVHSSLPIYFGSVPAPTTLFGSGPAQSVAPTISSYGAFGSPSQRPAFQAPVQATSGSGVSATSTSSTSSPFHSSSPFGSSPAFTSVSSAPTQALGPTTFGSGPFSALTPPRFRTMQDPVQASASSSSTSFSFGPAHNFCKLASASMFGNSVAFARPDIGISPVPSSSTTTVVFGTTPVSVSSPFGPTQAPVQATASSTSMFLPFGCVPASPASGSSMFTSGFGSPPVSSTALNSFFPPASSSNLFGQNQSTTTQKFGGSYLPGSSSSLFGQNQSTTTPTFGVFNLPGSSSNLFGQNRSTTTPNFGGGFTTTISSSYPNTVSHSFASHELNRHTEQGSRYPGYAPTPDGQTQKGDIYISISASNPYLHKSHEELRWEDYKQGVRGGSFPAAHASPIGSRPNTTFSPPTVSPSIFASRSLQDYAFSTTDSFGPFPGGVTTPSSTTVPPINSSVQRPHETAAVSSPAPGCTACGATSSSSASGHFTFNGATNPPSAATTPPGLFFPTTGFGPLMFGTNLAVQGTTPALQAYPVQGYIFLPFAAMSLQ